MELDALLEVFSSADLLGAIDRAHISVSAVSPYVAFRAPSHLIRVGRKGHAWAYIDKRDRPTTASSLRTRIADA